MFIAFFLAFYSVNSLLNDNNKAILVARYKPISDSFLLRDTIETDSKELHNIYRNYNIQPTDINSASKKIESNGKTIFEGNTIFGKFRAFKTLQNNYIYVQRSGRSQMFLDKQFVYYDKFYTLVISIGGGILALFFIIYIMILRKLYPLKRLHGQIEQFAEGNLNIHIDNQGSDEIGRIAQSFDKAISHIKQLISSKNLFMRNIMHELKTPITKGRIVSETIDDEMAKKILIRSFERMNELITDLADVERITMYNFEPSKLHINLSDVFERTEKVLMAESSRYTIDVQDRPIYTDKKLLALTLKNLMDNGIKYGTDKHVTVISNGNKIEVRSFGKPLSEDFSFYIEPFSQGEKRSHGFGLGLYIVNNILDKLGHEFRYHYNELEGINVFSIVINE